MAYKVRITEPAEADAYVAFERIREEAPLSAERWLHRLFEAVFSLADMPARCPLAPESESIGRPVRQLLFARGSAIYRILFDIQDDSPEGPRVRIVRIWHGSRASVQAEDVE